MSDQPPRLAPLPREEWTPEVRTIFAQMEGPVAYEEGSKSNVMLTLVHNPGLAGSFLKFNGRLLMKGEVPARLREIAILRVAHLYNSRYEWVQHVRIALMADAMGKDSVEAFRRGDKIVAEDDGLMTREEVHAVRHGAEDPAWDELERLVLRAVDELKADSRISDATWQGLSAHFSPAQMLELMFTIGTYAMMAGLYNSVGVQLESAQREFATQFDRA